MSLPAANTATGLPDLPVTTRRRQRDAAVFEATREALTEFGYDGVTMDLVADRAGVVKKTLYNRYGSKDGLLLAAVSDVIEDYRTSAEQGQHGLAALFASRRAAIRQIRRNPNYADAMTKALIQASVDHPLIDFLLRDAVAFTRRHLRVAQQAGELVAEAVPDSLAEQVVAQGWGVNLMCMKGVVPLAQLEGDSIAGLMQLLRGALTASGRKTLDTLTD